MWTTTGAMAAWRSRTSMQITTQLPGAAANPGLEVELGGIESGVLVLSPAGCSQSLWPRVSWAPADTSAAMSSMVNPGINWAKIASARLVEVFIAITWTRPDSKVVPPEIAHVCPSKVTAIGPNSSASAWASTAPSSLPRASVSRSPQAPPIVGQPGR